MSVMERAHRLAREGRQREAVATVEEAGRAGDGEALLALANWKLFGLYGPRDPSGAHDLLERAAAAGNLEAARTRAYLIGNGTGCASDPARGRQLIEALGGEDPSIAHQLALLSQIPPAERAAELRTDILSEDPAVRIVHGLLLEAECRYLMAVAERSLQPSFIVDPRSGRRIPHPVRTSMGMSFGPTEEDLVVHAINGLLAAATGTDISWGEPLQILRYSPGQEYKPHVDALPGIANQRAWTVLVYLNDDYSGGETGFTELDLTVRGNPGDALVFRNISPDGRSDGRTRHAGLPVTSGVKWLATRWIRAAPYSPWAQESARLSSLGASR